MLRGESNVAIVPAIGGDVVEYICLGEFFTLAQAEYSGLLTEPEAALSLFFEHFRQENPASTQPVNLMYHGVVTVFTAARPI